MSVRPFVGNLSDATSSDDLHVLFSEAGMVESCQLITDHDTDISKGFAFITMDCIESGDSAKERFNGKEFQGQALKVNDAKPKNGFKKSTGYSSPRQS